MGLTRKQFFAYSFLLFLLSLLTIMQIGRLIRPDLGGLFFLVFLSLYGTIIVPLAYWFLLYFLFSYKFKIEIKERILVLLIVLGFLEIFNPVHLRLPISSLKGLLNIPVILLIQFLILAFFIFFTIFYPLWKISFFPQGSEPSKKMQYTTVVLSILILIFSSVYLLKYTYKYITTTPQQIASDFNEELRFKIKQEFIAQLHSGENEIHKKCVMLSSQTQLDLPCLWLIPIAEKNPNMCNQIPTKAYDKETSEKIIKACEKLAVSSIQEIKQFECPQFSDSCWSAIGIFLQNKSICEKVSVNLSKNICLAMVIG